RRARSPAGPAPGSSDVGRWCAERCAERVADERVELRWELAGGIRELTQAQQEQCPLLVLHGVAPLGLGGDALEDPEIPLSRGDLALRERDDPVSFRLSPELGRSLGGV